MKPKHALRSFLCIASSALLTITYAQAATYTWSNLDDGTAVSANWSTGTSWSSAPVSAADTTLVFGYSFGSNSTAETNTLTNNIADPFQLNVLTLGINTPSAGNGTQIALINIAGSPLEFVTNGATTPQVNLNQNRSAGQVVSFDVQSGVVLTNNTLFTGSGTANFTVSGGISGAGSFTKSGTSALTLSGSTFSTGGLVMDGGTLTMSNAISSATGGLVMNAGSLTMSGNISSSTGGLDMNGGTWILSGTNNTYSGGSTIDGGTLVFRKTGAQSASGTHVFAAGTTIGLGVGGAGFYDSAAITSAFGTGTILTNVTVTATTNVGIDTTAGNFTHSADITGSPTKGLTKLGANTLILSGNNTYTGATTIAAGTLSIATLANAGSNSGIGAFATAGATGLLLHGGSFTYSGASVITDRGFTYGTPGSSTGATISVSTAATALTMGDVTINSSGSLAVTGGAGSSLALGTVTQNAGLSFTGTTIAVSIQSIILGAGGGSLGGGTFAPTIGDITGTNQNYGLGGASGTITGNIALGTGNLTKAGTGTWTLTGLSSYSGTTTLNGNSAVIINTIKDVGAGNSSLGAPTSAANGTIAFNGGTLRYIGTGDSSNRAINITNSNSLDMSGTGTLNLSGTLAGVGSSRTLTLTGATAGIGELSGEIKNGANITSVTKTGAGTWVLSGNSSGATGYTGATTVSAGRLHVTGSLKSAVTVASTATLSGTGSTTSTLALSAGSTIVGTTTNNSFQANTVTATSAVTIAGSDGTGTIGSGHIIGVVRYATGTGPTTGNFSTTGYRSASVANVGASGGETQLTYTNAARTWDSTTGTWDAMATSPWQETDLKFSQGDAVTFNDTGTGGTTRTVTLNSLVTPGSVTFNNSTSTTYTVSGTGTIDGLTALTKSGSGTVTLSNANTYTGATTVSGGVLSVNGSLANTTTTVQSGGTLQGSGTIGGSVTIQGGGTLATGNSIESLATGALSLEALSTFIYEANNNALPGVSGDLTAVTGNLTIALTNNANLSLVELGAGTWTVGEKLTLISYTGTWNGGLLKILGGSTIADDSTITFSGATWTFNYNDTGEGLNYTAESNGTYVTMTALTIIPEPGAALIGSLGLLALLRRRR